MKKRLSIIIPFAAFVFIIAASVLTNGCSSSSTSPGTTSTVTATNDMQNETISSTVGKSPSPSDGPTVDKLVITKVRVLIKDLHLHVSDDAAAGVGTFSSQPTILTFTPGSVNTIGT